MTRDRAGRMTVVGLSIALVVLLVLSMGVTVAASGDIPILTSNDDPEPSKHLIDPSLNDVEGEVEAVVVFEGPTPEILRTATSPRSLLEHHGEPYFERLEALVRSDPGLELEDTHWIATAATVTVDTEQTPVATLATLQGVLTVEKSSTFDLGRTGPPDGPDRGDASSDSYTYGLTQANIPSAWEAFNTRGEGTSIAILDTGIDAAHLDIDVHRWKDFGDDPSEVPVDYGDHGTHVAGTAVGGDESGTAIGVAPNARLYVGAVLTDCGESYCHGTTSQIISGMEWAVEADADVISLSLGANGHSLAYLQSVQNIHATGTTIVAATGNDGEDTITSPGNIYDVISVGAVQEDDRVWYWSGGGEIDVEATWGSNAPDHWPDAYLAPDVTAAGFNVFSALPDGEYGYKTGTSMAAPHVAGVVALMQSATDRQLDPEEIRQLLSGTAHHPAGPGTQPDADYGGGIVDAMAAIDIAITSEPIE